MIVIMKPDASQESIENLIEQLKSFGLDVHISQGFKHTVLGLIGDTGQVDKDLIESNMNVEKVMYVLEPFKKANRKFHPQNSIIDVNGIKIGEKKLSIMAGPCSVESREQIEAIATEIKQYGASILRGGAFKPRTSPYSFQGLELEGLELLKYARKLTQMPIVTEIISPKQVEIFEKNVDIIQVGARNMDNFDLLKEVGKTNKPVLLKRGLSATIEEWLMAAEYILAAGNDNVILCERGIRTFETYTRNTLDISAIPAVKRLSHLPVVVDPSHSTGMAWMVEPVSMAAIAAGADGLIIEVHNDPARAKCDGQQSITPKQFEALINKLKVVASVVGREV